MLWQGLGEGELGASASSRQFHWTTATTLSSATLLLSQLSLLEISQSSQSLVVLAAQARTDHHLLLDRFGNSFPPVFAGLGDCLLHPVNSKPGPCTSAGSMGLEIP